jgi:hypothetical protein
MTNLAAEYLTSFAGSGSANAGGQAATLGKGRAGGVV